MKVSVHSGGRRPILGGLATAALLAVAALIPSMAQAAAPANDDIAAATAIAAVPFSETIDTTEATTAADDPFCTGNGHTVWYTFTPSTAVQLELNTFGSTYDTTISVYTGSPGALSQVACNDDTQGLQSRVFFDATGGETYYIMAAAYRTSSPGTLTLTLAEGAPPPPVALSLSLEPSGTVDRAGVAQIRGTVSCNVPVFVSLSGSLTQTFARRFTIRGGANNGVSCTPPSVPWTMAVTGFNGDRFLAGPAQAGVSAFACDGFTCGSDNEAAEVRLRGTRSQ